MEERNSSLLFIGIIILLFFVVIILYLLFPRSSLAPARGLTVKFEVNRTLVSSSLFDFNVTLANHYDCNLNSIETWLESGKLFSINGLPLNNQTTKLNLRRIWSKGNASLSWKNIKVSEVYSKVSNIPISLKIRYVPVETIPFTVNFVRNGSIDKYGGYDNLGPFLEKKNCPIVLSLDGLEKRKYVYEEGKNEIAPLVLRIRNVAEGKCQSSLNILIEGNENLACSEIENSSVSKRGNNVNIVANLKKELIIPCNYTLSYLKTKEFDSVKFVAHLSCKYTTERKTKFTILPK